MQMAFALLVVRMLASLATSVQAVAISFTTYDGSGCVTQDQTFNVDQAGGDLCSGCVATRVTSATKGAQGTMYANMKTFAAKNEIHVFTQANCPYAANGLGMSMSFSSLVMPDWDKLKRGECIDITLYLLDSPIKTEAKSIKLKGTCQVTSGGSAPPGCTYHPRMHLFYSSNWCNHGAGWFLSAENPARNECDSYRAHWATVATDIKGTSSWISDSTCCATVSGTAFTVTISSSGDRVKISGLCDVDRAQFVNQLYVQRGTTDDGRPWYELDPENAENTNDSSRKHIAMVLVAIVGVIICVIA